MAATCDGSVMCESGKTIKNALNHLRSSQIAPSVKPSFVSKVTTWSFTKPIRSINFTSAQPNPQITVSVYNDTDSEVITFGDTLKCSNGVCTVKAPSTIKNGYIVVNGEIDATAGIKARCVTIQNTIVECDPGWTI